jgi:hypothetical protein
MTVEKFTGSQTDCQPSVVDLRGKEFFLATRVAGGFQLAGLGGKVAGVISEGKNIGQHTSIKTGKVRVVGAGHEQFGIAMTAAANGELVLIEVDRAGLGV